MKLEYVMAGLLFLFGLISAWRSLSDPVVDEDGRGRLLIAVHDAAKSLFWLSLGAFFLLYGLADDPEAVRAARWLALLPVAMAALRLVSASFLARS